MSALSIQPTFPIFTDIDGQPLDSGYVFIGQANLDPQVNPINVYWDAALSIPATQPIRTLGGYPARNGTPARLYVNSDYSIRVMNRNGSTIYSAQTATERYNTDVIQIDASSVEFLQLGAGAEVQTLEDRGRKTIYVTDYIDPTIDTAVVACQAFFQAAIDYLDSVGGGELFIPAGVYLITAPIKAKSNIFIRGTGDASQLLVNTDIEVINSDTTNISTAIFGAEFQDFFIKKTVSTATTKYDIHLQNPSFCNLTRVHIQSGHNDNQYSNTNVGGIWLDRPPASTASAFCNRIDDCWVQNNSIYFRNITDSAINGGFVWGHTRQFAIRIRIDGGASGAIAIENVVGIICSKFEGGIWLDGASLNQIRIIGNEFDGNPLLDTGYGVLCLEQAIAVVIADNTFWGCDYHGIWGKDCTSWSITGNNFWKNNAADNLWDDIRLECNNIPVSGCTISGNSHLIDDARVNPGLAVRLASGGGFSPESNSITGETVKGSYQSTGFIINGNNQFTGNVGILPAFNENTSGGQLTGSVLATQRSFCGINATANQFVNAAGTLDLTLNSGAYFGNGSGFVGHLYVSSTRVDAPTQSRRQIYTVFCYGTTASITSVASQDGSGGGAAFTITVPSSGVLRFTDTSGNQVAVGMTFVGNRSLA
jgi:hypothetical protein